MNKVEENKKENKIPMLMIDDLNLSDCDLIQLDCEGYEIHILEGGKNTIEKYKPTISLEDSTPQTEEFLLNLGYAKVGGWGRDTVYAAR